MAFLLPSQGHIEQTITANTADPAFQRFVTDWLHGYPGQGDISGYVGFVADAARYTIDVPTKMETVARLVKSYDEFRLISHKSSPSLTEYVQSNEGRASFVMPSDLYGKAFTWDWIEPGWRNIAQLIQNENLEDDKLWMHQRFRHLHEVRNKMRTLAAAALLPHSLRSIFENNTLIDRYQETLWPAVSAILSHEELPEVGPYFIQGVATPNVSNRDLLRLTFHTMEEVIKHHPDRELAQRIEDLRRK
jgi:hypothetical protein